MKVYKRFFLILILIACVVGAFFYAHQPKSNLLADYITKFNAHGGAYIVVNRDTGKVIDSSFINVKKDFVLYPHNINKLFLYAAGLKNGRITAENVKFEKDNGASQTITDEDKKSVYEVLGLTENITPRQLLTAYTNLINNKDNLLADKQINILKSALNNNVENGIAKQARVENIQVSGVSSTDYTSNNQVVTTFVGDFALNGKNYAIITVLEAPQAIKSTFGFNSAGWNTVPLAGEIINNIAANK